MKVVWVCVCVCELHFLLLLRLERRSSNDSVLPFLPSAIWIAIILYVCTVQVIFASDYIYFICTLEFCAFPVAFSCRFFPASFRRRARGLDFSAVALTAFKPNAKEVVCHFLLMILRIIRIYPDIYPILV